MSRKIIEKSRVLANMKCVFFRKKKHEKSRLKPKLSGESTWIDDVTLQNWWIKEQLKKSSCIDHGSQDPVCLDGT
jgi:hypothetical protein